MRGPFCEVMVKEVLPVLRALLAKKLSESGLSQKKVAEKMGSTQPAISQYTKGLRGHKSKLIEDRREILEMIEKIAKKITSNQLSPQDISSEFCEICETLEKDKEFIETLTSGKH